MYAHYVYIERTTCQEGMQEGPGIHPGSCEQLTDDWSGWRQEEFMKGEKKWNQQLKVRWQRRK